MFMPMCIVIITTRKAKECAKSEERNDVFPKDKKTESVHDRKRTGRSSFKEEQQLILAHF